MSRKQKLPNIILIVMDTVGAKHMSLYGYPRRTTPHLERIAEECSVYTRCFAPSCWTIPSHASMFTGLYPSQHGAHEANLHLNENYQHMASVLKMAGYRNFGIVSNGLVSPETGLCRDYDYLKVFGSGGFARFQAKFAHEDGLLPRLTKALNHRDRLKVVIKYFLETRNYRKGFEDILRVVKHKANRYIKPSPFQKSSNYTVATVKLFEEMLKEYYASDNSKPYFFFMNFIEAHELYRPPLKSRCFSQFYDKQLRTMRTLYKGDLTNHNITAGLMNLHDDEIIFLDHMISKIWGTIKKLPDFDNTVVIITSDHGEHFGEKGLYAHNLSLYNELIWVPLMVKFPGALTRKGVSDRLTSLNDLYPTVLDLTNSPLPSPKSSLSLLNSSQRDLVFSQIIFPEIWQGQLRAIKERGRTFSPPMVAVINDRNNKIIQRANGEMELYDLTKDKGEDHNLVETISSEAKQNLHHLLEYLKDDTGFNETVSRIEANDITNRQFPTLDF